LAYDYKKTAGALAEFDSANIRTILFQGMYSPMGWPKLAEDLKKKYDFLVSNKQTSTKRSTSPLSPRRQYIPTGNVDVQTRQSAPANPDPAPDYSIQAITCADAVDPRNTTTQMVFDEMVRVTRDLGQAGVLLDFTATIGRSAP
ncbi:hypothetical protein FRC07_012567, partial [Ceratobasidium sp. 392]